MAVQPGLCGTLSEIPKTGFLRTRFICLILGDSLRVIGTMSVGTDHIDQRKCEERNIYVARTPDVASDSAAELTIALILITVRRIAEGNTMVVSPR